MAVIFEEDKIIIETADGMRSGTEYWYELYKELLTLVDLTGVAETGQPACPLVMKLLEDMLPTEHQVLITQNKLGPLRKEETI